MNETTESSKYSILNEQPQEKFNILFLVYPSLAIAYLLASHYIFSEGFFSGQNNTLSIAYASLIPLSVGALASYSTIFKKQNWLTIFLVPVVVVLAAFLLMYALGLELKLRLVVVAPSMAFFSILGATLMHYLKQLKHTALYLVLILIMPYVVFIPEWSYLQQTLNTSVHTTIDIDAPSETVWNNIICVPEIKGQDDEFPSFVLWLGVPRPRAAVLSSEGLGGWRDASFDKGMTFIEKITDWQEGEQISFTIDIDEKGEVDVADEIDSELFQVIDATYSIEKLGANKVRLHLDSRERITSSFTGYGAIWTDLIMRSLQEYVMKAIKRRSEYLEERADIPLKSWCSRTDLELPNAKEVNK